MLLSTAPGHQGNLHCGQQHALRVGYMWWGWMDESPDYLDLFVASLGLGEGPFWIGRSAGRGDSRRPEGNGTGLADLAAISQPWLGSAHVR